MGGGQFDQSRLFCIGKQGLNCTQASLEGVTVLESTHVVKQHLQRSSGRCIPPFPPVSACDVRSSWEDVHNSTRSCHFLSQHLSVTPEHVDNGTLDRFANGLRTSTEAGADWDLLNTIVSGQVKLIRRAGKWCSECCWPLLRNFAECSIPCPWILSRALPTCHDSPEINHPVCFQGQRTESSFPALLSGAVGSAWL